MGLVTYQESRSDAGIVTMVNVVKYGDNCNAVRYDVRYDGSDKGYG